MMTHYIFIKPGFRFSMCGINFQILSHCGLLLDIPDCYVTCIMMIEYLALLYKENAVPVKSAPLQKVIHIYQRQI